MQSSNRWRTEMVPGDCTRICEPPGRLLPPYEDHTRGQLTATGSCGFSFSRCLGSKSYKTHGSQNLVISHGAQPPLHAISLPACPSAWLRDVFSKSLRVSSGTKWSQWLHLHFQTKSGQRRLDWIGEDGLPTKTLVSSDWRASGINWTMQIIYYTSLIELICKYVYRAHWVFW